MFPKCVNPDCDRSFRKLNEGNLFRFRRIHQVNGSPANSHSVEHVWLCAKCCETYTLEYRNDQAVLVTLDLPSATTKIVPKRANRSHSVRRSRFHRMPPANSARPPVMILAVKPSGDLVDRG